MTLINETAFEKFPILTTKRLQLRPILTSDAPALFAMQSDALIFKYISKPPQKNIKETVQLIAYLEEAYNKKEMLCWAATIREGDVIIGTCGFNRLERENSRAEIGGSLSPQYWGAGVALEAVEAILDYGFQGLELKSIEAHIDSRNRSAKYLLEQFGFVKEGHFKNRFCFEGSFYDLESWTLFQENFTGISRRE